MTINRMMLGLRRTNLSHIMSIQQSLAKETERFDPNDQGSNIDDYLREVGRCLVDLLNPLTREKLKLIWKTTSRSVHIYLELLVPTIRDNYFRLLEALREKYSVCSDQASATLGAFDVQQRNNEPPREFY